MSFSDMSTGPPNSWFWDFGDRATSTDQNPTHIYSTPGTYTVKLLVHNNFEGSNIIIQTNYIKVNDAPQSPIVNFISSVTSGTAPLSIAFTDTSTGSPTSWLWDFGDGTNSTEQNPAHIYSSAGTYFVRLKATSQNGVSTKSARINVLKATPTITWGNSADIIYGTALSSTQLNASASVPGTFVYTPNNGTMLSAGQQTLRVDFKPDDAINYNTVTQQITINVLRATPVITWNNPADITYGTPLCSAQLNASASVPGNFAYNPAAGTVLNGGTQTLKVVFTPTDTTKYTTASKNISESMSCRLLLFQHTQHQEQYR